MMLCYVMWDNVMSCEYEKQTCSSKEINEWKTLVLQAKKEIYDIKQQRLCLAQDEYNHLNNALTTLGASRTSCEYTILAESVC